LAVAAVVEQKMDAFYRDVALMDQRWARNSSMTIGRLTAQVSALSKETIRVRRFSRFHMGMA
jgi:translation elongation factor EF-Ts